MKGFYVVLTFAMANAAQEEIVNIGKRGYLRGFKNDAIGTVKRALSMRRLDEEAIPKSKSGAKPKKEKKKEKKNKPKPEDEAEDEAEDELAPGPTPLPSEAPTPAPVRRPEKNFF